MSKMEAAKYEKMWAGHYRGAPSPGLACVEKAHKFFGNPMFRGCLLFDFGCGSGKATKAFNDLGYNAIGIDHAINAVETDIVFVRSSLLELPPLMRPQYSFCVDVLEHIPTDHVDDVLAVIGSCEEAAFLQISLREDYGGKKIGETLHLTVKPKEWWLDKVELYFNIQRYETPAQDVLELYLSAL